jgi:DNA-binding response OmpR family regulator
LELGADDYVVKPFSVRELMARVRNVLRRTSGGDTSISTEVIHVGRLRIDAARRDVFAGDVEVKLTLLEFEILHLLARHVGQVFSREQLLEQVWGYDYLGDLRVVDAVIKRLRAKLREAAPDADWIMTVRGIGYKVTG